MTHITRPAVAWRSGAWAPLVVALIALLTLMASACSSDPDEIDADEFIRPGSEGPAPDRDDGAGAGTSDTGADADDLDDIDVADDVVRRYLSDAFGYSLELVCGPFCDTDQAIGALERVTFTSFDGGAAVRIRTVDAEADALDALDDLAALENVWIEEAAVNDTFLIVAREDGVLAADGTTPARYIDWEVDQRAVGGFVERHRTMIARVGPLAYFVDAGAVDERFEDVEPFLQQALETFLARPAPPSRPGQYDRWGFEFRYDPARFNQELGFGAPTAAFSAGALDQRNALGLLEHRLVWEVISADLFDAEEAVTDLLEDLDDTVTIERVELTIDGGVAVAGAVIRDDTEGSTLEQGVFAWYCSGSERSFILQSIVPGDALAFAQPSLDGFRCGEDEA